MVVDVVNVSASAMTELVEQLGQLGLWMQALGIVVVLWVVFEVVAFMINMRRLKEVYRIKEDMKRIEGKIDGLVRQRKR